MVEVASRRVDRNYCSKVVSEILRETLVKESSFKSS